MDEQTIELPHTEQDVEEQAAAEIDAAQILDGLAQTQGDISDALTQDQLVALGTKVIDDYETDKKAREDWERVVNRSLEKASQEKVPEDKNFPWSNASNVDYPLLTVGALQFNARAYPAIVKGDEAISVKVLGSDKGLPQIGPDGKPLMQAMGNPVATGMDGNPVMVVNNQAAPIPQGVEPEPVWVRAPGAKAARASRVKDYLNYRLFYKMDGWEADTDQLLLQLPIVGCAFRKIYYEPDEKKTCSKLVSALNLIVPAETKELKTAVRISEMLPPMAPFEILEHMKSGYFRMAEFIEGEDFDGKPRQLIEQHLRYDLDGDDYPEPYIVTVDHESHEVLRVVANYEPKDIKRNEAGMLTSIEGRCYYVKFGFFPHPEGKFYDIGLGHLLETMGNVIDTIINQMIDAGTAAVAGGGFIGSGVRLQGTNRSTVIRKEPGKWYPVNVPGDQLRNAMVEFTVPQPSAVMFQVLDLLMGAAQDISSAKDVLTGEASNQGQVGTTLALIEQGLQMFTAVYKRVFRSLKEEYGMIFENEARYADENTAQEYFELLDDPQANFKADFDQKDMDIRPVSDPTNVTKMQKLARANFLMSTAGLAVQAGTNPIVREIVKRAYEAADIEDIDQILVDLPPAQPDIKTIAGAKKDMAQADKYSAEAMQTAQETEIERVQAAVDAYQKGMQAG